MKVDPNQPVGQIAVSHREAIPILEKFKIDYYNQGSRPLKDACYICGRSLEEVQKELETLEAPAGEWTLEEPDWAKESTAALVDHIVKFHHSYTREQLDKIGRMILELTSLEGEKTPKLRALQGVFQQLANDLKEHMLQEEDLFFPLMVEEEKARLQEGAGPRPSQGNLLTHPLRILLSDHGMLGREWRMIEDLTDDFQVPRDPGRRLKELYEAFRELERDNKRHMHLEKNILFARAVKWGLLDSDEGAHGCR